MSSVDNRIVILQFDNKDFEKNVQTSMNTLDKLKNNLDFSKSAKNFDVLAASAKSFDLGPMGRAIESIKDRFSNLGIVGMTVLQNLTNTALDFGKRLVGAIFTPITQGGWKRALDIEQATFQMEGLLGKTENGAQKIKAIMNEVTESVKGTAFGANEAARVASQLVATGVEDAQQMRTYLDGVAGAAAMTGGAYDEIGHIFTTVAGQGRLMGDQLNQFAYRGLNIAATLSKQMGITEAEFRDMVSKGLVSFDMFAAGLAEAFGDQAVKANETFTGSLSNMKAALARIGQEFAAPALTNFRDIFNSLRGLIDAVHEKLKPLIDLINNGLTKAAKRAVDFIDDLTEALGGTSSRMKKEMEETAEATEEAAKTIGKSSEEIEEMAKKVIAQEFGNGAERRQQLEELGYSYEQVQNKVNELLGFEYRYEVQEEEVAEVTKKTAEETEQLADSQEELKKGLKSKIFEDFYLSLWRIKEISKDFGKVFKKSILKAFSSEGILKSVSGVSGAFRKMLDSFALTTKSSKGLEIILTGLFNLLGKGASLVLKGVEYFFKFGAIIGKVGGKIVSFVGDLFDVNAQLDETTRRGKFIIAFRGVIDKLGDSFSIFKDRLKETWERVKNTGGFIKLKSSLESLWSTLKDIGGKILDKVIEKMEAFAGKKLDFSWLDGIVPLLGKAAGKLADFVTWIKNGIPNVLNFFKVLGREIRTGKLSKITDLFSGAKDSVLNFFKGLTSGEDGGKLDIFSSIKGMFQSAIDNVGEFFSGLSTNGFIRGFKDFIGKIIESSQSLDSQTVLGFLQDVGKIIVQIIAFATMVKFFRSASKMMSGIGSFFENIGGYFKNLVNVEKTKLIIVAIAEVVAALWILSKIPAEDLNRSVEMLGFIMLGIFGIIEAINYLPLDSNKMKTFAVAMAGLGVGLLAISGAAMLLSGMNWKEFISSAGKIAILVAILVAASRLAGSVKAAAAFMGLAVAVNLLIPAIVILGHLKWKTILKAAVAIGAICLELGAAARLAGSVKAAAAFLGLAVAIDLIVPAFMLLGKAKWSTILKGAIALGVILAEVSIATRIASSEFGGKGALALLSMALTIGVIAVSLKVLGNMDTKSLITAAAALAGVMLSVSLACKLSETANPAGLLMMAGALAVAVIGLYALKDVPWETLVASAAALAGVVLATSAALKIAESIPVSGGVVLIAAVAALALVAVGLSKLAQNDWKSIVAAAGALAGVVLATSAALKIAQGIPPGSALGLAAVTASLYVAAASIAKLAEYDWKSIVAAAASLAGVVLAISVALRLMSAIDPASAITGALSLGAAIDIVLGLITAFVAGIGELSQHFDLIGSIQSGAEVLSAVGNALGGFAGGIAEGFASHLPAVGEDFATFAEKIGPFMELCGQYGVDAATTIGGLANGLAAIVGSELVDNIQKLFTGESSLSQFGQQLEDFVPHLKKFSEDSSDIDVESCKNGAEALGAIAEAAEKIPDNTSVSKLASVFVGVDNLDTFGPQLAEFGPNLQAFSDACTNVSVENCQKGAEALSAVAEAAGSIKGNTDVSKLAAAFTGTDNLSTFGPQLAEFAPHLQKFSDACTDISLENCQNGATAIAALADAAGEIDSNTDVSKFVAFFTGVDNLDTFGGQLETFAPHLKKFSDECKDINATDVENAAGAVKALAQAASNVGGNTDVSDFVAFFTGEDNLSTLGPQLATFGGDLKRFALLTSGITTESISPAIDAMTKIITSAAGIEGQGVLSAWWNGDKSLGAFGEELALFGGSLKTFSDEVKDVKTVKMSSITHMLPDLIDVSSKVQDSKYDKLDDFGGAFKDLAGKIKETSNVEIDNDAISTLVETINTLVELAGSVTADTTAGLSSLIESFQSFGTDSFAGLTSGMSDAEAIGQAQNTISTTISTIAGSISGSEGVTLLVEAMQTAASDAIDAFIKEFEDAGKESGPAYTAAKNLCDQAKNGIPEDFASKFKSKASSAATQFVAAITAKNPQARSAGLGLATAAKAGLDSGPGSGAWYTVGSYCASGFAQGLGNSAAIKAACDRARELVKAAKRAAEQEAQEASPSKVFYRIGYYCVLGFANALKEGADVSAKYGRQLVAQTVNLATQQAEAIQNAFDLNTDLEPVITPVIDLSNIKSGARQINGLFSSGNYGIGINNAALMNRLAYMTSAGVREDSNKEVVNAINGLKGGLGNMTVNVTVDGAENPEDFADRFVRALMGRSRI